MKFIVGLGLIGLVLIITSFSNDEVAIFEERNDPIIIQDTSFDVAAALTILKEQIKGREQEPSSEVYENVEIMGQFPAGRLLAIMEHAFNGSLGVTCNHCHNPNDWASDEKNEKVIAREMWKMVGTINQDLLGSIKNLKGSPPAVNCTTCHRGDVTPKLSMR